jgi:adenylate cyclase
VLDDLTEERNREETLNLIGRYLPPGLIQNIHEIASLGLGGERREVTSVFADVCPLSAVAQGRPPQEVMELLNTYLAAATEAIHEANGVIDKYIGTEVMVLFNTQLNPQDNHALRAVEAALNLRDNIIHLQQEMGITGNLFQCRVGVHSGVATMGNVGSARSRRNFTAIGDTINLSKRLEENARNGQIIVSEDTLRSITRISGGIPESIAYQELEAIKVKGREQRTVIYEVHRAL